MIDTHCHLTYEGLYERVEDVVSAAQAHGVDRMISVGTNPADAERAHGLSQRFDSVYATVGLHPSAAAEFVETADAQATLQSEMRRLMAEPQVVALGELGMDKHYYQPDEATQRRVLDWQLEVAHETDLPLIVHNRETTHELLEILRDSGIAPERFVFHCFAGTRIELDAILGFGAMVSLTGLVTFNSARQLAEATDSIPVDRLMLETDAPYLTPHPHRSIRPNEPKFVPLVAEFLANRRDVPIGDFKARCDANAERFFFRLQPATSEAS